MKRKVGLFPLARNTFDVEFAQQQLTAMLLKLDELDCTLFGSRELLFDADAAERAIDELRTVDVDQVLVLQITFTDASSVLKLAKEVQTDINIWSVPEPRLGGRLRLNSLCGLNLASHALGNAGCEFGWLFTEPASTTPEQLNELLAGLRQVKPTQTNSSMPFEHANAHSVMAAMAGKNIVRIGQRPEGFTTCDYNAESLKSTTGISVTEMGLDQLFQSAEQCDSGAAAGLRENLQNDVENLDCVDQPQLLKSLKLHLALQSTRKQTNADAFALRCWPETFTEYGGAVCGAVSMHADERIPCACEADVYGAATQLLLQEIADAPVFLVDLVDVDIEDDSAVVWHCGQAPRSFCRANDKPRATIHTNRKMPLLFEFALKGGPITLARLSQSRGSTKLVLATATVLDRDMAYTGTSGTLRFDAPVADILEQIINSGLEHHVAIAYGDHRDALRSCAAAMKLPLIELGGF